MQNVPAHLKVFFDIPLRPVACLDTQKKTVQTWKDESYRQAAPTPAVALSDTSGLNAFIYQALDTLGKIAEADRVHVWAALSPDDTIITASTAHQYAWSLSLSPSHIAPQTEISPHELEKEPRINDLIRYLHTTETPEDTLSIMAAPVTFQGRLWGFIGFDDCHAERIWTNREENILRAAATLIGNVLESHHVLMEARDIALRLEESEQGERREHDFLDCEDFESPPLRRGNYLQRLTNSAKSLLRIINDVLDFSKAEAGELNIRHAPFLIRDIALEIFENGLGHVQTRNLTLECTVAEAVNELLIGDAQHLSHILMNLIDNAITFTDQGKISLSIDMQEKDNTRCFLHCAVSDTGIGLKNEHIEHIFTPFAHIGTQAPRRGGGLGLGLALCKKLIEAMGGTIRCDSVLGAGSIFSFRIAVGIAAPAEQKSSRTFLNDNGTIQEKTNISNP